MKLTSHGTGGARRRCHCREHRAPTYRGGGDGLVLEVHATDGRMYTLRLSVGDVAAELAAAGAIGDRSP